MADRDFVGEALRDDAQHDRAVNGKGSAAGGSVSEERAKTSGDNPTGPQPFGAEQLPWPDRRNNGRPAQTCANARMAIKGLGIDCRYDVFHDRKLVSGHVIEQWAGELSDDACHMLRVVIKQIYGFDPGKETPMTPRSSSAYNASSIRSVTISTASSGMGPCASTNG